MPPKNVVEQLASTERDELSLVACIDKGQKNGKFYVEQFVFQEINTCVPLSVRLGERGRSHGDEWS